MPVLFAALLVVGAANAVLRPIVASLQLQQHMESLQAGLLLPARVGPYNIVASPDEVALWQVAIAPEEIESFDRARELWQRLHTINPGALEKLQRANGGD